MSRSTRLFDPFFFYITNKAAEEMGVIDTAADLNHDVEPFRQRFWPGFSSRLRPVHAL